MSFGFRKFIVDQKKRELLSAAFLAFTLRAVGAVLAFALNVVVARLLGAEGTGLYFLALSVVMTGAVIARMGLDSAVLRFVATGASRDAWGEVRDASRLGLSAAASASFLLALTCFFTAPWIAEFLFHEESLAMPLRWMSFGIFTYSVMMLYAECLKGLKHVRNSMLVSGVLYPAVALILVWPLSSLMGASSASLAYVIGTGVAASVGLFNWRGALSKKPSSSDRLEAARLWRSARPLWLMSIVNQAVLPWLPLFFLGYWGGVEDSGIFGAATRVAMLVSFFLAAVNTVLAPKFAELYAAGQIDRLVALARRISIYISIAASPFFLLLIFAGDWVMSLFGSEFVRGGVALAILAVGQAVNTLTGSVGYLLIMTGNEKDVRNSSVIASAILLVFSVILIPFYGLIGAAISSATAVAVMNVYSALMVRKRLWVGLE